MVPVGKATASSLLSIKGSQTKPLRSYRRAPGRCLPLTLLPRCPQPPAGQHRAARLQDWAGERGRISGGRRGGVCHCVCRQDAACTLLAGNVERWSDGNCQPCICQPASAVPAAAPGSLLPWAPQVLISRPAQSTDPPAAAFLDAVYGINGGYDHTATKAALTLLFGSIALMLGTASRYRWPQVSCAGPGWTRKP